MNCILLFALLIQHAFCHYVSDGNATEGVQASMRFANIDYYTKDETVIQIIQYVGPGDEGFKIPHSDNEQFIRDINIGLKTYVLFNGHPSEDSTEPYMLLKDSLLGQEQVNVFFVYIDWTKHQITFLDALSLAESFGQFIGDILYSFNIPNNQYHLIAHCAGAEIATSVANRLYRSDRVKIPRMTVFDPYITNDTKLLYANEVIDFLDVYHAGIYDPPFAPVGNIDFYPNAGVRQPGCNGTADLLENFICHHRRSIYLYIESLSNGVNALEAYYSLPTNDLRVIDNPKVVIFGHLVDQIHTGAYYMPTYETPPYLMDYF